MLLLTVVSSHYSQCELLEFFLSGTPHLQITLGCIVTSIVEKKERRLEDEVCFGFFPVREETLLGTEDERQLAGKKGSQLAEWKWESGLNG